jgi:hypothetical protein
MALMFPYRFALAMFRDDGSCLGTVPAKRDWEPAHEWTRFYFQRRGELPLDANGDASVLPLWERTLGEPYCRGYRIEIPRPGRHPVSSDFPTTHLREFASAVASVYVERKELQAGETYSYMLLAYPAPREAEKSGGLSVINSSPSVPARDASLKTFLARSKPTGVVDGDDMPVFVSQQLLWEAAERTLAEQGTETGGTLIGMLWRNSDAGEIFAEVTAQIPAEFTSASNVKLTFTAQTWAAADAALRLRGRGESYLGYWHSHPVREWCKSRECTLEKQKFCHLAKDFFSADDEAIMRAAFPRAYNIAIVANDTTFTDLTFSMFGNREGILQPRGFYVLEDKISGS